MLARLFTIFGRRFFERIDIYGYDLCNGLRTHFKKSGKFFSKVNPHSEIKHNTGTKNDNYPTFYAFDTAGRLREPPRIHDISLEFDEPISDDFSNTKKI